MLFFLVKTTKFKYYFYIAAFGNVWSLWVCCSWLLFLLLKCFFFHRVSCIGIFVLALGKELQSSFHVSVIF